MERHALSDVNVTAITLCKKGANRKRFFLRKSAETDSADVVLPASSHRLLKSEDWSAAYCVVAEPGAEEDRGVVEQDGALVPDPTEGVDVWTDPEEIRSAAYRFMKNGALVTKMHESLAPFGTVVENAIALDDFTVDGEQIKKGSWYIAIAPSDEGRKLIEAGELEAVSLEGTGLRTPLTKKALTTKERNNLPASAFVFPKERRYPIHDLAHARNALARSSGKPEEATVRAAVYRKYPQLRAKKENMSKSDTGILDKIRDLVTGDNLLEGEESGTLEATEHRQEDTVDEQTTTRITELEGKVETLTKTIEPLAERLAKVLDKAEQAEPPTIEDLKKSLDDANERLAALGKGVDQLAAGASTQPDESDELRKQDGDSAYYSALLGA